MTSAPNITQSSVMLPGDCVAEIDSLLRLIHCATTTHPKVPPGRHVRCDPPPAGFEKMYCRIFALYEDMEFFLFQEPLNAIAAGRPDYYESVKKPMSLRKMLDDLAGGRYANEDAVWADVDVLVENCVTFNGKAHTLVSTAYRLRQRLRDSLKVAPPDMVAEFQRIALSFMEDYSDTNSEKEIVDLVKREAPALVDDDGQMDVDLFHVGLLQDCMDLINQRSKESDANRQKY